MLRFFPLFHAGRPFLAREIFRRTASVRGKPLFQAACPLRLAAIFFFTSSLHGRPLFQATRPRWEAAMRSLCACVNLRPLFQAVRFESIYVDIRSTFYILNNDPTNRENHRYIFRASRHVAYLYKPRAARPSEPPLFRKNQS